MFKLFDETGFKKLIWFSKDNPQQIYANPTPSMSYPLSFGRFSYVVLWITTQKDMKEELNRYNKKY